MSIMPPLETLLSQCGGTEVIKKTTNGYGCSYQILKVGEVTLPSPVYVRINATATKGTVGRVVGIECQTNGELYKHCRGTDREHLIIISRVRFIFEVAGRLQTGKIAAKHTSILHGVQETKYVRTVNAKPKVEVKNPVNKFKQELQRGDWVVGIGRGKRLIIGRITRWTNHNVWCSTGDLSDKGREVQLDSISQTFLMPDDAHTASLTMAVLKGWSGN